MSWHVTTLDTEAFEYFQKICTRTTRILDIGPGAGSYSDMLRKNFHNIDAIEIFEPNIQEWGLLKKYGRVIHGNVMDNLPLLQAYDVLIFGDVLEHLSIIEAQKVVRYVHSKHIAAVYSVPYAWPQDKNSIEVIRNPFELHKQDDLCVKVMQERYPQLKLLIDMPLVDADGIGIGIYIHSYQEGFDTYI